MRNYPNEPLSKISQWNGRTKTPTVWTSSSLARRCRAKDFPTVVHLEQGFKQNFQRKRNLVSQTSRFLLKCLTHQKQPFTRCFWFFTRTTRLPINSFVFGFPVLGSRSKCIDVYHLNISGHLPTFLPEIPFLLLSIGRYWSSFLSCLPPPWFGRKVRIRL